MDFVILIHPIEVKRRRIVTGRMAHLSLKNSRLFMGQLFNDHPEVNALIQDPNRHPVLLYPGAKAANLSTMSHEGRAQLTPPGRRLTLFVIDGTWATAKKTVNQSPNLNQLPRVCFTPTTPSEFRVRKQPRPECYSTIEAIHHTIELLAPALGRPPKEHDRLKELFRKMVDRQLELKRNSPNGSRSFRSLPSPNRL